MMFKAGECITKIFINFSMFVSLCSIVFFFITLGSDSKENATEKALGESPQTPRSKVQAPKAWCSSPLANL